MINETAAEPRDDVPEADWAEQQAVTAPDGSPTPRLARSSSTEANSADLAEQELEVVLDDED